MEQKLKKNVIISLIFISILSVASIFAPVFNALISSMLLKNNIVENANLLVHFISVGQGDAVAINLPDDKVAIIDTGTVDLNVQFTNYLQTNVFNNKRGNKIDYLILTHFDTDHIGGARRLIENFDIENVYISPFKEENEEANNLLLEIGKQNINKIINKDKEIIAGANYLFQFYGPISYDNSNDSCPLIKLTYNNYKFLFTGDISSDKEAELLNIYANDLDCDVLKVAHHGSKTSSSLPFLQAITPKYAVISCGTNNYGHPSDIVCENLALVGATTLRTDALGNILFTVKNGNLALATGSYTITGLSVEIRYIILGINFIIIIILLANFIKYAKFSRKNAGK